MDHDRHYDNRCRSGDFLPGRLPRGNFILFSFLRKWTGGSAQRVNGDAVVWKHVEIGDAAVLISFSESLRWKRWKFVSFRRTYENELEILLAIGVCTESIGIIIYLIDIIDTRFIASYVCEYRNEIHDIQSR